MFEQVRELYKYRALLIALVRRHLAMRYRGSLLGFLWSFLNPLLLMMVYTIVFRYYVRFDQVQNYSVFVFCGLLPWLWMTSSLSEGTSSIVGSGHLITKSMFPAHLLPAVAVITTTIHFLLSLPLLLIFMLIVGAPIHLTILLLPVVVLLQALFAHGIVLALSALNVHYRDVQHLLANLLTFLFFLCPVLYPINTVPDKFRFTIDWNPFAILTVFYHQIILEGVLPSAGAFGWVSLWVVLSLLIGTWVYNRYRESFAEVL